MFTTQQLSKWFIFYSKKFLRQFSVMSDLESNFSTVLINYRKFISCLSLRITMSRLDRPVIKFSRLLARFEISHDGVEVFLGILERTVIDCTQIHIKRITIKSLALYKCQKHENGNKSVHVLEWNELELANFDLFYTWCWSIILHRLLIIFLLWLCNIDLSQIELEGRSSRTDDCCGHKWLAISWFAQYLATRQVSFVMAFVSDLLVKMIWLASTCSIHCI